MKYLLYVLFLSSNMVLHAQQTLYDTIMHGGLERAFILYVPDNYDPGSPTPLVMNFHGYTSNAFEQMWYGDFRSIADTAGFIIVHPQGTQDLLGNPHWNVGWGSSTVNDVAFTASLIDSLTLEYNINPDRIYSTGMSNGGFFSYLLACQLSDRIAAIASVTGSMNVNAFASCASQHAMPVMEIHGTADGTVPYDGNFLFASTGTVVDYWVNVNQCDDMPTVTAIPDINTLDGCTVEHQIYSNGNNGSTVEHYKIIDGGHTWPGAFVGGAGTNQDIDASKEIWRFFSQYDIHGLIQSTSAEANTHLHFISIFPNPTIDFVTINRQHASPVSFSIISPQGIIAQAGELTSQTERIDLSGYPAGMYFLRIDDRIFRVFRI